MLIAGGCDMLLLLMALLWSDHLDGVAVVEEVVLHSWNKPPPRPLLARERALRGVEPRGRRIPPRFLVLVRSCAVGVAGTLASPISASSATAVGSLDWTSCSGKRFAEPSVSFDAYTVTSSFSPLAALMAISRSRNLACLWRGSFEPMLTGILTGFAEAGADGSSVVASAASAASAVEVAGVAVGALASRVEICAGLAKSLILVIPSTVTPGSCLSMGGATVKSGSVRSTSVPMVDVHSQEYIWF